VFKLTNALSEILLTLGLLLTVSGQAAPQGALPSYPFPIPWSMEAYCASLVAQAKSEAGIEISMELLRQGMEFDSEILADGSTRSGHPFAAVYSWPMQGNSPFTLNLTVLRADDVGNGIPDVTYVPNQSKSGFDRRRVIPRETILDTRRRARAVLFEQRYPQRGPQRAARIPLYQQQDRQSQDRLVHFIFSIDLNPDQDKLPFLEKDEIVAHLQVQIAKNSDQPLFVEHIFGKMDRQGVWAEIGRTFIQKGRWLSPRAKQILAVPGWDGFLTNLCYQKLASWLNEVLRPEITTMYVQKGFFRILNSPGSPIEFFESEEVLGEYGPEVRLKMNAQNLLRTEENLVRANLLWHLKGFFTDAMDERLNPGQAALYQGWQRLRERLHPPERTPRPEELPMWMSPAIEFNRLERKVLERLKLVSLIEVRNPFEVAYDPWLQLESIGIPWDGDCTPRWNADAIIKTNGLKIEEALFVGPQEYFQLKPFLRLFFSRPATRALLERWGK